MQFTEDFKQKVGKWVFQRELKTNTRTKEACNINDAKSIGILYDATSTGAQNYMALVSEILNDNE